MFMSKNVFRFKNTEKVKQNTFELYQKKKPTKTHTQKQPKKYKFSRESSSSQPRTIQKETDNLVDAGCLVHTFFWQNPTGIS